MPVHLLAEYRECVIDVHPEQFGRLAAALRGAPVTLALTQQGLLLRAGHDVGWFPFRLGDEVSVVVVVPKGSPEESEAEAVARFFDLVAALDGLPPQAPPRDAGWSTLGVPSLWPVVLGRAYVQALEDLVRNDLRKGYRWRSEALAGAVRGRLDAARHAVWVHTGRAHLLPCTWEEYDLDFLDNRILVAAMEALARRHLALAPLLGRDASLPRVPGWVADAFAPVPSIRIGPGDLDRACAGRLSPRYRRALALARVLLRASAGTTTGDLEGWTINANRVFQRLGEAVTREAVLSLGLRSSSQGFGGVEGATRHLTRLRGREAHELQPDLVVHDGRRVVAVGDSKYKKLFEASDGPPLADVRAASQRLHDAKSADLYQLFVYLRSSRCSRGFFIAPYWDARPGAPPAGLDESLELITSPHEGRAARLAVVGLNLMAPAAEVVRAGARALRQWLTQDPAEGPGTASMRVDAP